MNTLTITFSWFGVGVAIGIGIVAVVIAAIKLSELYEKLHPKKKQPDYEFLERQLSQMGRDFILFSYDFKPLSEMLKEKIKELRKELWAKDIVLQPVPFGTANFPLGLNCIIKIEGKEVFEGEITPDLPDEQRVEQIMSHIKDYYAQKEKSNHGNNTKTADE